MRFFNKGKKNKGGRTDNELRIAKQKGYLDELKSGVKNLGNMLQEEGISKTTSDTLVFDLQCKFGIDDNNITKTDEEIKRAKKLISYDWGWEKKYDAEIENLDIIYKKINEMGLRKN